MTGNSPRCWCFRVLVIALGIPCGLLAEKPASPADENGSGRSRIERILGGDRDHQLMREIVEQGTAEDYEALRSEAKRLGGRTNADVGYAADELGYRLAPDAEKARYLLWILRRGGSDLSVGWAVELAERHLSPEIEREIEKLAGGTPYEPERAAPDDWLKAQSQIALRKLRSIREVGRERAYLRASQVPLGPGVDRHWKEFKMWGIEGLSSAKDPQVIAETEKSFTKGTEAFALALGALTKRLNLPGGAMDRGLQDALQRLVCQTGVYRGMYRTLKALGRIDGEMPTWLTVMP